MTLANRLKLFVVLWFAIVMALFTFIFENWFSHHTMETRREWIGQQLSDITSANGVVSIPLLQNTDVHMGGLSPGAGIQFIDSNQHLVGEKISPHFPGDLLKQFQKFTQSVSTKDMTVASNWGPLITWFPVYTVNDDSGYHEILAAQAPIDFTNGSTGMVLVFTTLDDQNQEIALTTNVLLLVDICTLILLSIGTHILIERGLQPLKLLIDGIRSVEWAQSKRLTMERAPREIMSVVNSVNQFLKQVEKGVQDQSRFIADASHELRTPLAIIAGHANILRRWGKTNAEVWEPAVHHIVSEVGRLQSLIDRLLTLARLESGYQPASEHLTADQLRDLLLQLRDDARVLRSDLSIKALIHLASHVAVSIAGNDLRQILVILVDNAMKHTPSGGHVDINANWDDTSIRFSVFDTGEGISEEALPHVFDRFYRSEEARSRTFGGFGLGLSICKHLTEVYGGKITIRSKVWSGTTVTVILPRDTLVQDLAGRELWKEVVVHGDNGYHN